MTVSLPRCTHCDARMTPYPDGEGLWCQFCGQTRTDAEAIQLAAAFQQASPLTDYEPPARRLDLTDEECHLLNESWHAIQEGDRESAAYLLRGAVAHNPELADAWYLLALTTEDSSQKRDYLDQALIAQPYHEYAWREKGVLNGVIPARKAAPQAEPDGAVEAVSDTQACPLCGGALTFDAALGKLTCRHCNHSPGDKPSAGGKADPFEYALMQRRFGFTKEWHIGERVLECQNCAAQLTLLGTILSTTCPFCDTAHVLVCDTVQSFEEPDALLPFEISREAAAKAVHRALSPALRSQVERGDLQGVYLPFWSFEFQSSQFMITNVLVSGVKQPAQAILAELVPYDLSRLIAYDPRYLAQWPAQLYTRDAIEASITGWVYIKHAAWKQSNEGDIPEIGSAALARTDVESYRLPDMTWSLAFDAGKAEGLRYQLILLPVWMVTLHLEGGLHRPAVVNGQTGEVIISASFLRPQHVIARPRPSAIRPISPRPLPVAPRKIIRPIRPR